MDMEIVQGQGPWIYMAPHSNRDNLECWAWCTLQTAGQM
jgi:hypothetical protein